MATYQPKLPFLKGIRYSFNSIENPQDSIIQNFKNLLKASRFEKIDDPDFGCNLAEITLFQYDTPSLRREIETAIRDKTEKYFSNFINITNISFEYDNDTTLLIKIKFYILNEEKEIVLPTTITQS
jgi:phage baseplate assembly protein W